jgi:hypothetical protein
MLNRLRSTERPQKQPRPTIGTIRQMPPATVIAEKDVRQLGKIGVRTYIEHKGVEYQVGGVVDGTDRSHLAGETVLAEPVTETDRGKTVEVATRYRLLFEVPRGTYAADLARSEQRRGAAALRPVSALAGLSLLDGRNPHIFAAAGSAPARGVDLPATGYAEGRSPIRGRDIVTAIDKSGVRVLNINGHGVILAPRGRAPIAAKVTVETAWPLIGAHYAGAAWPACELPHGKDKPPEAVDVLVGGIVACAGHASGALEPDR